MPRFSANLGFLWPDRPLIERIDAAALAGFKAIELHWPYDVPAEQVRERCAAHGLVLLGVNVRGDVGAAENGLGALIGRERAFQDAVDQSIDFCLRAGGAAIHCMAGRVASEDRTAARAVFLDNLRVASAKAAPHGLTLLLEPLNPRDAPGYFYATPAEGAAVIAEAGRANLKLMFDCYHVGTMGGDVIAELDRLWPVIGHIQIAGVPTRAEPDGGQRQGAGAVVHLHLTHSVAVSCLHGLDPCNCLPPLTAYDVMRVGRLPIVPCCRPARSNPSPARTMPSFSPTTARSSPAPASAMRSTRPRNSGRPRGCSSYCATSRSTR